MTGFHLPARISRASSTPQENGRRRVGVIGRGYRRVGHRTLLTAWFVATDRRGCTTSGMIVEYIRYEVPSASRDTIVEAYRSAGQELAASAQCMRYEIAQGVEEPGHFTVRIEWR